MDAQENQPEQTGTVWQSLPIAWLAGERFAPQLTRGTVGARLLIWTGNDTQWASPLVSARENGVSWTGSLNFTAEGK